MASGGADTGSSVAIRKESVGPEGPPTTAVGPHIAADRASQL
ncbi:DUF6053 domain-containing protein [Lysobacter yananisis]